jgi:4'-phosphopantetheinyl transferase EntD
MVSTFKQTEAMEWNSLVLGHLGEGIHPERVKGFILAREALRLCLEQAEYSPHISDLQIKKFNSLSKWPEITLSLTHCKLGGAAIIASRDEFISVGIDIESEERLVKESILKRISHPKDINLRNIELWCLKEAVFKCLMNTGKFEKPFEFSEIEISPMRWIHSPSNLEGEWRITISEQLLVALALLENQNSSQRDFDQQS